MWRFDRVIHSGSIPERRAQGERGVVERVVVYDAIELTEARAAVWRAVAIAAWAVTACLVVARVMIEVAW